MPRVECGHLETIILPSPIFSFALMTGNAGFYEIGIMITPLALKYSVLGWNHPGFGGSTVRHIINDEEWKSDNYFNNTIFLIRDDPIRLKTKMPLTLLCNSQFTSLDSHRRTSFCLAGALADTRHYMRLLNFQMSREW